MTPRAPFAFALTAGARIPHPLPPPHVCLGGPTWTARTAILDGYQGLAYGRQHFVATGHGKSGTTPTGTMISLDKGQTWAVGGPIANVGNASPQFLRFGNDIFLCVIGGAATPVSTDAGATWTNHGGTGFGPASLWFGNDLFVVASESSAVVKSTVDGNVWASHAVPAILSQCFWDDTRTRWLALESGGVRSWTSPDLDTWTLRGDMPYVGGPISGGNVAQALIGPNAGTIVCGYNDGTDTTSYTDDGGATWGVSNPLVTNQISYMLSGNGIFIAVKSLSGLTEVSSDGGRTWVAGNSLTANKTWLLAYNGLNSYAAVGDSGSADTIANVGDC